MTRRSARLALSLARVLEREPADLVDALNRLGYGPRDWAAISRRERRAAWDACWLVVVRHGARPGPDGLWRIPPSSERYRNAHTVTLLDPVRLVVARPADRPPRSTRRRAA